MECKGYRYLVRYLSLEPVLKSMIEEARRQAENDFRMNFKKELELVRIQEAREVLES